MYGSIEYMIEDEHYHSLVETAPVCQCSCCGSMNWSFVWLPKVATFTLLLSTPDALFEHIWAKG